MTGRRRLWLVIATTLAVIGSLVFVATRDGGGGGTLDAGAGDQVTTTSEADETTTTETTSPPPTTTTSRGTTRPSVTPIAPTTAPPRPLLFSHVRVGAAAPCRNASTTTYPGGSSDIDGCYFFIFWPVAEQDVNVRLHSSRGLDLDVYGPPCQINEGECHGYMGAVYDRAVGEHECFWLTTTDAGWASKSNEICIDWPQRP